MLTIEQRKRLTEFLGEEWVWPEYTTKEKCSCGECTIFHDHENRTFTTWEDFGVLKDKIVKIHKWDAFDEFALKKKNGKRITFQTLTEFIFDKDRFPLLVYDAIEAGVLRKEE